MVLKLEWENNPSCTWRNFRFDHGLNINLKGVKVGVLWHLGIWTDRTIKGNEKNVKWIPPLYSQSTFVCCTSDHNTSFYYSFWLIRGSLLYSWTISKCFRRIWFLSQYFLPRFDMLSKFVINSTCLIIYPKIFYVCECSYCFNMRFLELLWHVL